MTGYTYAHDPVVVKEAGTYYRFGTGPGVPISVSKDLKKWTLAGKALPQVPEWTRQAVKRSAKHENDFWAPDAVRRGEEWRMYYSVSTFGKNTSAIGLASCRTIAEGLERGFEDRGMVIASNAQSKYNCIDPAAFIDERGGDNLLFGSFWGGLFVLPLDAGGMVKEHSPLVCVASRCDADDERYEKMASGQVPNPVEGGYVYRHDGKYYLFASHDYCCRGVSSTYRIVVGRSDGALGPYYDKDGEAMTAGGGSTIRDGGSYARWAGPGHNSVFCDDDGAEYLVCHAYDRDEGGKSKVLIERIAWQDGWPVLGSIRPSGLLANLV